MVLTGKAKMKGETQTFGNNGFRKRELVIVTDEQYPQYIMIEFVQDKCDLLNPIQAGDTVQIGINLRGREWVNPQGETKYFNSIQGWKVDILAKANEQVEQSGQGNNSTSNNAASPKEEEHDDLPF